MPVQPCSPTQESSPRARAHPFVSTCIVLHWTGRSSKQKLLILSTSSRVGVRKSLLQQKNLHNSLKPSATARSCKSKTLQVRRHLLQSQAVSQRVSGIDGSRNLFNTDPTTLCRVLCPKLLGRQMHEVATCLSQQHTLASAGICEQTANEIPPKDLSVHVEDPHHLRKSFHRRIYLCFGTAEATLDCSLLQNPTTAPWAITDTATAALS